MGLDGLRVRILQLLALNNAAKADIENALACFDQFRLLGLRRNDIVHRMVLPTAAGIQVHNLFTAVSVEQAKTAEFTFEELEAMRGDCDLIFIRLAMLLTPPGLIRRMSRAAVRSALLSPWRYKPLAAPPPDQAK